MVVVDGFGLTLQEKSRDLARGEGLHGTHLRPKAGLLCLSLKHSRG